MSTPVMQTTSGFLLINKPSGPTSYDMIRWLKRTLPQAKIGHCGTLDPLASGLMILLLGKATKRQDEFMKLPKVYRCEMTLGIRTSTGDTQGETVAQSPVPVLSEAILQSTFEKFLGDQSQIPPMYSAVKINGVPLYKLARKGQEVEREVRKITIRSIHLLGFEKEKVLFRLFCSSGTYVRTLAEDIGRKLGTEATVSALVREKIGDFDVQSAVNGEDLHKIGPQNITEFLSPLN